MENTQFNYFSGNEYQGRNQAELQNAKIKNGFKSDEWLTFLQAKEKGLKIKKGSKAISVFKGFNTFQTTVKNEKGKQKIKNVSIPLGFAKVFNLDQTENFKK